MSLKGCGLWAFFSFAGGKLIRWQHSFVGGLGPTSGGCETWARFQIPTVQCKIIFCTFIYTLR
jgi:hypothetical protein